jgi:hypothetical protein
MTLLRKYALRTGSSLESSLLTARVEQAMTDKAVTIMREANPSAGRKAFAERALGQTSAALAEIMPYVVSNATVASQGAAANDGDLEYVVHTETIDGLWPVTA